MKNLRPMCAPNTLEFYTLFRSAALASEQRDRVKDQEADGKNECIPTFDIYEGSVNRWPSSMIQPLAVI